MTMRLTRLVSLRSTTICTAALVLVTLPRAVRAFETSGGCYSTAPDWNAVKGVIVSGETNSPIKAVINAIGEVRTHSMLSNGGDPGGMWATHSTSMQASVNYVNYSVTPFYTTRVPHSTTPIKPIELAQG